MRAQKREHLEPASMTSPCPKSQLCCQSLYHYCLILLGLEGLLISPIKMLILMVGIALRARVEGGPKSYLS